jgi:amino acid transporter
MSIESQQLKAAEDVKALERMGYRQELSRRMNGFSNFAISMSTICILAGGITSFSIGFCSVGGASIGLGWPLACLFSLTVALTMAQVASAFPTAGGPYHWASILGGKGWGWTTACFNLAGLVTVLAAINVGTWEFVAGAFSRLFDSSPTAIPRWVPAIAVILITVSQALVNHWGIRLTSRLTDFSGYLILVVSTALTVALLVYGVLLGVGFDVDRLVSFANYSGQPEEEPVWPRTDNIAWLFLLGLLLPAYTVTGFDASAQTSEETIGAAHEVPRGIVRAVLVSGLAGWLMLAAIVLAAPDMDRAANQGDQSFFWILGEVLPDPLLTSLLAGIAVAQYLCGLATMTSASRMAYAFARDGGLPWSRLLRRVSQTHQAPSVAIWTIAGTALLFALSIRYATIAAVCAIFLYLSYVLPTAAGLLAHGRTWTRMGPWQIGRWYRPLAALCVMGCLVLIVIGLQPLNDIAVWVVGCGLVVLAGLWFGYKRHHFPGPPHEIMLQLRQTETPVPPPAPAKVSHE